jgi:glucose/arabinose dehydrogenase
MRSRLSRLLCPGFALLLAACPDNSGTGTGGQAMPVALRVEPVVSGLSNPLFLTSPAADSRLFIVEQPGRIRIVENGNLVQSPFLDLSGQISGGGEQGLLGLAFHPSYVGNGFFYVYYTARNGDITIDRYTVSPNPNVANPVSGRLVLRVAHSAQPNHNGGMLAFGADGNLYIGTGDGGGGGDPDGNGQNANALLGKLLRIDVDAGDPYAIPPDNPFVGTGARGEIWALGLRNPWRWAFDRTEARLYVADVGQNAWEEINVISATTAGVNYGWDVMEGRHCFEPSSGCSQTGLTLPVLEYSHAEGCSITGGFVYRGAAIPDLQGTYFYADYCRGWVRSFRYTNGAATEQQEWGFGNLGNILSFGEDAAGELYILSANGTVYQIVPGP